MPLPCGIYIYIYIYIYIIRVLTLIRSHSYHKTTPCACMCFDVLARCSHHSKRPKTMYVVGAPTLFTLGLIKAICMQLWNVETRRGLMCIESYVWSDIPMHLTLCRPATQLTAERPLCLQDFARAHCTGFRPFSDCSLKESRESNKTIVLNKDEILAAIIIMFIRTRSSDKMQKKTGTKTQSSRTHLYADNLFY